MKQTITILRSSETVFFAASELARYLRLISVSPVAFDIVSASRAPAVGITLGLFGDGLSSVPGRENPFDDAIDVGVMNGAGCIAGVNERSVLLGVYRFLHELGCRWVRPGIDGEYLPRVDLSQATVTLNESASFRHRTICIEGAVSVENVLQMIDWAPKVGYSGYFMQFPFGNEFFARYYQHPGNPSTEPEPFSADAARQFTIHVEQEIKKRGLIYHAIGHGWHTTALGLGIADWNPHFEPPAAGDENLLAQVKGKRAYQWDRPMITSLCYANPEVERRLVDVIAAHAVAHPEVDILHVWLDDGGQNKCECDRCATQSLADVYVRMLRKLADRLDSAGSAVKIVFLSYSDLLWPPVVEREMLDTDRFIFMYANSRQSYSEPLRPIPNATLPEFVLNKYTLHRDWNEFNAFLQAWQSFFDGDGFLFEYYMTVGRLTFDQMPLARVIYEDLRSLPTFGMNGITSCQVQRVFFPTGLAMYVLGHMLWNNRRDFDELVNDFFFASFGAENALCKEFLKVSAEELQRIVRFDDTMTVLPDASVPLAKLDLLILAFQQVVDRNRFVPQLCHAKSWYYVDWYLQILRQFTGLFKKMAEGASSAESIEVWNCIKRFVYCNEDRYQSVFDVHAFCEIMDRYIITGKVSTNPADVVG